MLLNAYSTLRTLPSPIFPYFNVGEQRDRSDPALSTHLDGFIGYVLNTGKGQMTNTLYGVMRHIQRVQHHISIEVEDSAMNDFAAWAWQANAIVFLSDGTVRDPAGRILVSQDVSALDPEARVPYPEDALQRKVRSEGQLSQLGLSIAASLPPVIGEGEVRLRSASDVTNRVKALFAVALRAESLEAGSPIPMEELEERLPRLSAALSPAERNFLNQVQPEPQQVTNFVWRYESLFFLQWALGLVDELSLPVNICDVPLTAKLALQNNNGVSSLRPTSEILDALDLHYRLHWATRQANLDGKPLPIDLNASVIFERHHALNWLIRFEDKEWDEVDIPT